MTLFPIGHLTLNFTFRRCPFNYHNCSCYRFSENLLVTQKCVLEISYNFLPFTFIENFQHPFPEASQAVWQLLSV